MGLLEVRNEFEKIGIVDQIIILEECTSTVEEAAHALHIEPARVAKTLTLKSKEGCLLIVTAGNRKIDNSKFKKTFKSKAKMLTPDEAYEYTGHMIGGICPFGLKQSIPVYLDVSLKKFTKVYPACGDAHSAIGLSIEELEQYSHMKEWVDVTKDQ